MLVPKLVTTLKGYTREQFIADATAGVILGFGLGKLGNYIKFIPYPST